MNLVVMPMAILIVKHAVIAGRRNYIDMLVGEAQIFVPSFYW
jgi:hypothetical protein